MVAPMRLKVARPLVPKTRLPTPPPHHRNVIPARTPVVVNRVLPTPVPNVLPVPNNKKYLSARANSDISVRYGIIEDPTTIFGMVGRCGGGYNTVWQDWSDDGRKKRELIMAEFEEGINKINGHYTNLEKSIKQKGMLSPIVITCGMPLRRKMQHLPPEMLKMPVDQLLLAEGIVGGSRLYIAQKLKIPIICLINDRTGRFSHLPQVTSVAQANSYFQGSPPTNFVLNKQEGLGERGKQRVETDHVDPAFFDDATMAKIRGPMWLDIMQKYGYTIELTPHVRRLIYGN